MAGILSLTVTHRRDLETADASRRREYTKKLENLLHILTHNASLGAEGQAYASASSATGSTTFPEGIVVTDGAVQASGSITLSAAAGAVGATIGGTLVTVTASGGDAATATALAAAINANTTVNKYLVASILPATPAQVKLVAIAGGPIGNFVTLVASGTGATVSGANFTGGVSNAPVTYAG